jgi:type IV pilus assembly protein PilY1
MKRAFLIIVSIFFFSLTFLLEDVPAATNACSNSLSPPFIAAPVKPNVLIILDNSNSMDEGFSGNAVGSYSPVSKSVAARQALQSMIQNLQTKARVGIMTYSLPGDTSSGWDVHNAMPFTSFDPVTYCPDPPSDCATYCATGDPTAKSNCEAACPGLTTTQYEICCNSSNQVFKSIFPDYILALPQEGGLYAFNEPTGTRARYCGLAYPKTTQLPVPIQDPNGDTVNMYWNVPDPMYAPGNWGTRFGYSGSDDPNSTAVGGYSPYENATCGYAYYDDKLDYSQYPNTPYPQALASDLGNNSNSLQVGYSSLFWQGGFQPTDSDWALGFYNWGQKMPWYYVGPTWFSASGPGSPQGYLHVAIDDMVTNPTQYNNLMNILNPNFNDSSTTTGYMSCTFQGSQANACPYIVNAGNTPAAGTLLTALNYFNGTLTENGTQYNTPIILPCQQNFIIYVTDGLPDTMLNGNPPSSVNTASVMPEVLAVLEELSNPPQCLNSSGTSNGQPCTTISSCPSPYNASCSAPTPLFTPPTPWTWAYVTPTVDGSPTAFAVKTYVLGIGSEATAGPNLNNMAIAGGTAVNGQAYYAKDSDALVAALGSISASLLQRVAAGSAISILSEGQADNGDNMLQAVFYPNKYYGTTLTYWPGYLYSYWFYNSSTTNNIREDTVHDYILELNEDDGIVFNFNETTGLSVILYSDPTGSGTPNTQVNTGESLDALKPLWEAGKMLFQQTAASRVIYTPGNSTSGLVSFDTSNATLTSTTSSPLGSDLSSFDSCLGSSSTTVLKNLINYVRGSDIAGCRSRTVGLCSNGSSFSSTPCASASDCTVSPYTTCTPGVWKLGDIVYSTPKVVADYKYCSDGTSFNTTACSQDADCSSGTSFNSCQTELSVAFVGANDGMLHAFQTGVLSTQGMNPAQFQIADMTGIPTSSMGAELWGFIPENALPYLRCLASSSNCHLYYNDLSPYVTTMNVDATTQEANGGSITTYVTKKILIGGMRLGGGSVQASSPANYCFGGPTGMSNGQSCTSNHDCGSGYNCLSAYPTNVPADTCSGGYVKCTDPTTCYGNAPQNPSNCIGLSSYYAIDITDPKNPVLLWEFSHPLMGYTYSGPAVIHKWSDPSTLAGDKYYVMFLSGPTQASDGSSVQDAKIFVLSLDSNLGISQVYYKDLTNATNGFGGRLFTNGLDVNGDGYTDFVFFGYSSDSSIGNVSGWSGGIGVVTTNSVCTPQTSGSCYSDPNAALDPSNWIYDTSTFSNLAQLPITSQIGTEQCFGSWYLYAGTGRYFFPLDNYTGPANSGLNLIMGIPFNYSQQTGSYSSVSSPLNTTSTAACTALQNTSTDQEGWQITLDAGSGSYFNERMISDPVTASGTNEVFMITSEPSSSSCNYGGQTRVWGLNCATGAAIADTSCSGYAVSNIGGTLYLQTSTGAVNQINIGGANNSFNISGTGDRTTQWYQGMPPETGATVVQPATAPSQKGQLIQWIER